MAPPPSPARAGGPRARYGAALVACGARCALLHGGYDGAARLRDCHRFELAPAGGTAAWAPVEVGAGDSGNDGDGDGSPAAARWLHALVPLGGSGEGAGSCNGVARLAAIGGVSDAPVAGASPAVVAVIESAAAARGTALAGELLRARAGAAALEARCAELAAHSKSAAALLEAEARRAEAAGARWREAQRGAAAAERRAERAEAEQRALARRLARARAGGELALRAAREALEGRGV